MPKKLTDSNIEIAQVALFLASGMFFDQGCFEIRLNISLHFFTMTKMNRVMLTHKILL